jgi:DNA invertase Pin-like site-specific DNA recombinase
MARVLGARRLSHDTDASTSTERQGDSIDAWARSHSHSVVYMTDDTDVSGAVSPFDRDDLGPWLRGPKLAQWDVLAVAKLDRISRSLIDFANLLTWCQDNGKSLVSVAESLDFSTPTGQFIGKILILFAEWERETMRARRADASRKIAANAGWHGGHSTEWGYSPVQRDGRWVLESDPEQVPLIREVVDGILAGESAASVADRLGLDATNLIRRLRRPSLYGMVVFKGEIVRGPDGMPLTRAPVIDRPTWSRLQAKLDGNSRGRGVPRDAAAWFNVVYCDLCGHPLHLQRYSSRPNRYYTHKKSLKVYRSGEREWCPVSVQGQAVESQIHGRVLRAWQGRYAVESVEIPGEDHTEELRQVEEAVADWESRAMLPGASADSILRILDGLNARRQAIIDAGVITEPAIETVTTDISLADLWLSQPDDHARGALLRRMGYRIYVRPDGRGKAKIRLRQVRNGDTRHWSEMVEDLDDFDEIGDVTV